MSAIACNQWWVEIDEVSQQDASRPESAVVREAIDNVRLLAGCRRSVLAPIHFNPGGFQNFRVRPGRARGKREREGHVSQSHPELAEAGGKRKRPCTKLWMLHKGIYACGRRNSIIGHEELYGV